MHQHTGPKFDAQARARIEGLETAHSERPTGRGWLVGLLSCAFLGFFLTYAETMVRGSRTSGNLPPAGPIIILAAVIIGFNLLLSRWRARLALTRQDLALVFCMTLVANPYPGWSFLSTAMNDALSPFYYERPEFGWKENYFPYYPTALSVRDPYEVGKVKACADRDVGGTYQPGEPPEPSDRISGAKLEDLGGVALEEKARVLLVGQNDARQNGVYVVESVTEGRLKRAPDADVDHLQAARLGAPCKVNWGLYTFVEDGTHKGKGFWLTTTAPVTLNSSALTFESFSKVDELPKPNEWFYRGLPEEQLKEGETPTPVLFRVPWRYLLPPFIRWGVALLLIVGIFLTLSALLHPQWCERERLPFPIMQIPANMVSGLFQSGPNTTELAHAKPFFLDRLAQIGMLVAFLLQSYNALQNYVNLDPFPFMNTLETKYLTEDPWKVLSPIRCNIYLSVIGIAYLISLEVSFSLWFFYLIVLKLCTVIAITFFALGTNEYYFHRTEGPRAVFIGQGTGALFTMVIVSFFMARSLLWGSLKQALGLTAREAQGEGLSPRLLWGGLAVCLLGAWYWMVHYGVTPGWAAVALLILTLSGVGIARVVSEGGVVFLQMVARPSQMMDAMFAPAALGPQNFTLIRMWSERFSFEAMRNVPMINLIGAFHLATQSRLRFRPLVIGLLAGMALTLSASFVTYVYIAHTAPNRGTALHEAPARGGEIPATVQKLKGLARDEAAAKAAGKELGKEAYRDVREPNSVYIWWMVAGTVVMFIFVFLRTRVFWWPHPIGYVMWIHPWPLVLMWFSYFIGWLCKALIMKFGGQRTYLAARRFFIGLIVGEAAAMIFWIIVGWLAGKMGLYSMVVQ